MKPRIKGKWFDGIFCKHLKWSHNDINWFHTIGYAIEQGYKDLQLTSNTGE